MKRNLLKKLPVVMVITAVLFTTVFSASVFVNAAGSNFTPRLTAPESGNKYYYNGSYNVFQQYGYGLPNCTAYAYGRAYEILGSEPNLSWNGAGLWYDFNRSGGYYDYGRTPKVGAIACWSYSGGGHVAVVETIDSDGYMTLSNSEWGGRTFYLTHAYATDSNPGGNSWWTFQGYIYLIDSANVQTPVQTEPAETEPVAAVSSDYEAGTYLVDGASSLNMRSGAGMGNSRVSTVTYGTKLIVTETSFADNYNWGYTSCNGVNGWVALEYCSYVSSSTKAEEPTTVAPTTVTPATVAPTTVAPTTVAPATAAPTTVAPTTAAPATEAPATTAAVTEAPATAAPSTAVSATVPATESPFLVAKSGKQQSKTGIGRGDIDEDGVISIQDATLVQQYLAGMIQLNKTQRRWCDVNCDGHVNIDDATYLQRLLLN